VVRNCSEAGVKGPLEVHRELLSRGIAHEIVHLRRVVAAADGIPRVLELPARQCLAVRVYTTRSGPGVAVLTPARCWPDLDLLGAALTRRRIPTTGLRPATSDEASRLTDFRAALVSPILLPADVALIAEASCTLYPVVYVPTGDSGTVLGISSQDLMMVSGAGTAVLVAAARTAEREPLGVGTIG
jgi:prolyl-tRNA editing enzyme YbaK/EbsC (Cys-tRNA(Pro) deacylase)